MVARPHCPPGFEVPHHAITIEVVVKPVCCRCRRCHCQNPSPEKDQRKARVGRRIKEELEEQQEESLTSVFFHSLLLELTFKYTRPIAVVIEVVYCQVDIDPVRRLLRRVRRTR